MTVQTSKLTALYDIHRALGATFMDFAGWAMPLRYDSEIAEHTAVRTTAGLFDLSHMGEIEVTGRESGRALDFALVGRPSRIASGRARYTMICDVDGGIIDDLVVYRLGDERYLVVANASNATAVARELRERARGFEADVDDASERWSLIAVQGPRAAAIAAEIAPLEVVSLPYYAITKTVLASRDVLIARTGYTGEDGFEVYCHPDDAAGVWNSLAAAGKRHDLRPAGLACRDTLRLEAGMPLYGQELDRTLTPFDAGLGRVVTFDKEGGFVGDQAILDRRDQGSERTLVGLVTGSRRTPRHGHTVVDPSSGEPVGWVTSGAPSPTLGHPIAMAYVDPSRSMAGTPLKVEVRGSDVDVQVVELPFYRRRH
ncbi:MULTISPECIES: glycine cleavage system aminomethyltransferase GcvT [Nocardioides]|uniref:Aminomethyltransferase n=1 Tax=Nocardioides vastitatis TaxID=2568655 RepID=A0ABW0ZF96_9ACTN|nr:glycine cleavage system aminomethyltransferase GcvT [Nocardioides sp.]THI96872.1 glycine cleavage system aminomethyltransferase GcvT [Nocardioides sp.]